MLLQGLAGGFAVLHQSAGLVQGGEHLLQVPRGVRSGLLQLRNAGASVRLRSVQFHGVPGQGVGQQGGRGALHPLHQQAGVPQAPMVGVLGISQGRLAQALPVDGRDTGAVNQVCVLRQLPPEMPVFQHRQGFIEPQTLLPNTLRAEQHGMDGQVVDAQQPLA